METILGITAYVTAVLFLLDTVLPRDISPVYGFLALLLLSAAFFSIQRINKIIISILTITAVFIAAEENFTPAAAAAAFGTNVNILALFILIPLVGSYMSYTGYLNQLKQFIILKSSGNKNRPYRLSFTLMCTAGLILNFGSMAIIRQIADESFRSFYPKKMTLHMMRGFACCMLWSPYFVNVGLVLALFDVSWFTIFGYGLVLAVLYGVLSAIFLSDIKFSEDTLITNEGKRQDASAEIIPLLRFTLVFIGLSFLVYYAADATMIEVVTFLAILIPYIFAVFKREVIGFSQHIMEQITGSFQKVKNELAIFIAAGFFGTAVAATNFGTIISELLIQWTLGSVLFFTVLIMFITLLLALVGIHPIIIIIGIGSSITPAAIGISAEYAALLLLVSWTVATQLSPFSGQVLLASRLMSEKPVEVSKKNSKFVLVAFVVLSTAVYSFHFAGLL
ncbi:hypothetical protein [Alkalicoccus daliensis]|uniref:Uncharacterized protein n=1 Tax=Alkalicoccus daliensis TaxID=745820 RepID=A0A1H0AHJ9_9BACI|nr:hypothetical protein [Alkalicoccus daliensis]SDN33062.1 hypothetical protein SAMN04488053_101491 [Alkalicoccus daliensis]